MWTEKRSERVVKYTPYLISDKSNVRHQNVAAGVHELRD